MSEESKATSFGERVKEVREELNISVQDAAEKAGVSESYWSLIEDGSIGPKVKMIWTMAIALGVRPHNLLV